MRADIFALLATYPDGTDAVVLGYYSYEDAFSNFLARHNTGMYRTLTLIGWTDEPHVVCHSDDRRKRGYYANPLFTR